VIDPSVLRLVLLVLAGWLARREREAIAYLVEGIGACGASWGTGGCA
jgi:hypothetical protein